MEARYSPVKKSLFKVNICLKAKEITAFVVPTIRTMKTQTKNGLTPIPPIIAKYIKTIKHPTAATPERSDADITLPTVPRGGKMKCLQSELFILIPFSPASLCLHKPRTDEEAYSPQSLSSTGSAEGAGRLDRW
jgi:hypothetical protein